MIEQIDLVKLAKYVLKRLWVIVLCAVVGFGAMYTYTDRTTTDTYTASATLYVYNANPNAVNYQYTSTGDLSAALKLVDTYSVVIRSNKVLDAVAERISPSMSTAYISRTISVASVSNTGVMRISCTTSDPQMSMDICNAVADIAPAELIRVVGAGSVQVIDYAGLPSAPNNRKLTQKGMTGALVGGGSAAVLILVLFLLNRRLNDSKELTDAYNLPLLATVPQRTKRDNQSDLLISEKSSSQVLASYGKLRINTLFATQGTIKTLLVSSAIPGEGKSTLTANLAASFAMDGSRVLLIDCDLRKPTQEKMFRIDERVPGLSEALVGMAEVDEIIHHDVRPGLDLILTGTIPPNPTELLHSQTMADLLMKVEPEYDWVLLDMPPINVVVDSMIFADMNVGMLFVTRCDYSDHREIAKALQALDFAKVNILGMVMNCAHRSSDGYYNYRYYNHYYGAYDKNKQEHRTVQNEHHHSKKAEEALQSHGTGRRSARRAGHLAGQAVPEQETDASEEES